jgi:protein SCO1/2
LWGLGFVSVLGLAFAVSEYLARQWVPRTQTGFEIGAPFELTDHTGQMVTEDVFIGRASAVFFGFTNCPEICPTTLNDLANARQAMDGDGDKLQIIFITLDPERDTVNVLKDFIPYFGERITGITGSPEAVLQLAKDWGIFWERIQTSGGGYTLDHTATVFLLNRQGRMAGTIDIAEPPDVVEAKLKKLVARM